MNYLANWAKHHIVAARLLITLLHIYIVNVAMKLAEILVGAGVSFPFKYAFLIAISGFCIIAVTGTLLKKQTDRKIKRRLQKCRFLLMGICCTILLVGYFASKAALDLRSANAVQAAFTTAEKKEKPVYDSYNDKKAYYNDLKAYYNSLSKKELRKELRQQLKALQKNTSPVVTILGTLLIVFSLVIALFAVVILSCSLACNGQGALAVLLLVAGTTGLVFLTIYISRQLRRQREKEKQNEDKKQPPATGPNGTKTSFVSPHTTVALLA